MAAIVLVHGVDNEQFTPDGVEAQWLPALAGGVRLAGRADLADRLWPQRSGSNAIECRSGYYGDLFRTPGQQGGGAEPRDLNDEQSEFAYELALEWLERITERATLASADVAKAQFGIDLARNPQSVESQGIGNLKRQILKTLASNSWLARAGMTVAERFVKTALTQVTRYLSDELIRSLAQQRVLDLIEDDTRVIVGHSLGSVVSYECSHRLPQPLPLLVTVGSPLGLKTIVKDRLRPPPSFPPQVVHWMNVADHEDFIAAEPDLRPLFAHDMPDASDFTAVRVDNGSDPHNPVHYLGKIAVGRVICEALS